MRRKAPWSDPEHDVKGDFLFPRTEPCWCPTCKFNRLLDEVGIMARHTVRQGLLPLVAGTKVNSVGRADKCSAWSDGNHRYGTPYRADVVAGWAAECLCGDWRLITTDELVARRAVTEVFRDAAELQERAEFEGWG